MAVEAWFRIVNLDNRDVSLAKSASITLPRDDSVSIEAVGFPIPCVNSRLTHVISIV